MDEQQLIELLLYVVAGFVAQMIDGALGMAYGVSASSLLLTFGVPPASASASVHVAKVFAGGASGLSHWRAGNVVIPLARRLAIPGVIGACIGAFILTEVPPHVIRPIVAAYLLLMGLIIVGKAIRRSIHVGSERHLLALGAAGGFCDALGGGGWGPIVTGTLLARGNEPRTTIGSVNFAEFFVAMASTAMFMSTIGLKLWRPAAGLAIGGLLAAPIAARLTGRLPVRPLMFSVGLLIIALSLRTIVLALR
jgi:uncharacterized membrane protein YfcA